MEARNINWLLEGQIFLFSFSCLPFGQVMQWSWVWWVCTVVYILVDSVATEDELHTYTVEIATTGKKLYIAVHVMYNHYM